MAGAETGLMGPNELGVDMFRTGGEGKEGETPAFRCRDDHSASNNITRG